MNNTHTHKFISQHFTSLRHAQILGGFLLGSLVLVGSTFAQLSIDTNLANTTIVSNKIFISPNGLESTEANSKIFLNGDNGNVHIKGKMRLTNSNYTCTNPNGCALATSGSNGLVVLTGDTNGGSNNSSGGVIFTKKGLTGIVDTGAYDVYFADPAIVSNSNYTKVRIGIVQNGQSAGSQLITRGAIESRAGFTINSPVNSGEATNLNAGAISGNTLSEIVNLTATQDQALTIRSRYAAPGEAVESHIILKSSNPGIQTKVGINTSLGSYATKSLDVVGKSLSRETLTVGYNTSGDNATGTRAPAGIIIPNPSNPSAIIAQSCDQPSIPAALQCTGANCNTVINFTGNYGSYICYAYTMAGPTMTSARAVLTISYNNRAIVVADTNTMRVGINTLAPRSAFDVNGNSYLDGALRIIGDPLNIASISNGFTNARLVEINSKETTPFMGEDMCCKVLSVDRNNNIVLVQLPPTMCTLSVACGGTGNGSFSGGGSNSGTVVVVGGGLGTVEEGGSTGSGGSNSGTVVEGGNPEDGSENTCPDGQVRDGDQCIENPCADDQIRDANTFACVEGGQQNTCPDGQVRDGDQCIENPCKDGQIRDAEVLACVENPCPEGQIWDLNQCIENPCRDGETYDFVTRTCR